MKLEAKDLKGQLMGAASSKSLRPSGLAWPGETLMAALMTSVMRFIFVHSCPRHALRAP